MSYSFSLFYFIFFLSKLLVPLDISNRQAFFTILSIQQTFKGAKSKEAGFSD